MSDQEDTLSADERRWIAERQSRCPGRDHLAIFHNGHCCSFCMVDKCPCKSDGSYKSED